MAHLLTVFSVPETDCDSSVSQGKFPQLLQITISVVACWTSRAIGNSKSDNSFFEITKPQNIFGLPIFCLSQTLTIF